MHGRQLGQIRRVVNAIAEHGIVAGAATRQPREPLVRSNGADGKRAGGGGRPGEAQQDALSSSREYMTAKNELAKARKSGDENKIALAQAAVQEIEQKALAPHAEAIRSLTETRDLIDRELGVAPPATAAGSSGWGTAKQVR